MSLVGSLEDLGLGEILQIISLSRKSGSLMLRSTEGEGRILFHEGEIRAASLKGEPTDLGELLVRREILPSEEVDRLFAQARATETAFEDLLTGSELVDREQIDTLRREHVEAVVLDMFRWGSGEFSFEVQGGSEGDGLQGELVLSAGINPQFLALEGMRLQDESRPGIDPTEDSAPAGTRTEGLLHDSEAAAEDPVGRELTAPELQKDLELGSVESLCSAARPAIVVIDPDLPFLERVKAALSDDFPHVHIFQRSDLGIARIRQYLARGETPAVLLSGRAPADPVSGARDWREILARLKSQAARMAVFLVADGDEDPLPSAPPDLAGVLPRPDADASELGAWLRDRLVDERGSAPVEERSAPPIELDAPTEVIGLREATAQLRTLSPRTDVLPLVLRFAAQTFRRVAIFMVRDRTVIGMGQCGLARAGGPDDRGVRRVVLPAREAAWFRRALQTKSPVCAPPGDEGDRRVSFLLGNTLPPHAYVAPIESGGRVVALLYADNLPGDETPRDTHALELVLHEAGAALDRLVRARASEE